MSFQELPPYATDAKSHERLFLAGYELIGINEDISKVLAHPQFHITRPVAEYATAVQQLGCLVALWHRPEHHSCPSGHMPTWAPLRYWLGVNEHWKRPGYWEEFNRACQTAQEKAPVGDDRANLEKALSNAIWDLAATEEVVNTIQSEAQLRVRVLRAGELPATSSPVRVRARP